MARLRKGQIVYITICYRGMSDSSPDLIEDGGQWAQIIEIVANPTDFMVDWITGTKHNIGISKNAGDEWETVPPSKVPGFVWAEIAKRQLLGENS